MMNYNFDERIDRRHTDCLKYEMMRTATGRDDLLPLWVADMDFRTPPFVTAAVERRLRQGILGYPYCPEAYAASVCHWLGRRHGLRVEPEAVHYVPGVVPGLAYAVAAFTEKTDGVLIQPPVYHPFHQVVRASGRRLVESPLRLTSAGRYDMDFDDLARKLPQCRLMLLCNPHNPGGFTWPAEVLRRLADMCRACGVTVVSDEIHADLTLPGYVHTPFASVSPEARDISITFGAPSKAFNMPGLASSYAIAVDPGIRRRFQTFLEAGEFGEGHMLAYVGCAAAYREGEEWLGQLLAYIQGNIDFTEQFLKERIPAIGMIRPQASYLIFLDCRRLGLPQPELVNLFVDKAHLALNDGTMFGRGGEGFMRLNVGCPRSVLRRALEQLEEAVSHL